MKRAIVGLYKSPLRLRSFFLSLVNKGGQNVGACDDWQNRSNMHSHARAQHRNRAAILLVVVPYDSCELFFRRSFTFLVGASFLTLSITMSILALYQNQQAESEVSKHDAIGTFELANPPLFFCFY